MKRNRTAGLLFIVLIISGSISAQQLPVYDLCHQQKILINPASTADNGAWSAFLNSRSQWVGISGAPKSMTFGVQGLLDEKMALGACVLSDRSGLIERLSVNINYAYLLTLADEHKLSLGLNVVINENQLLMNEAKVNDANDYLLGMQSYEGVKFDAGFGLKYNWRKFELGFSIPYLMQSKVRYYTYENNDYLFDFYRHYNLFLSYLIPLKNPDWVIEPMLMYRNARSSPSQIDINVLCKWQDKYWLGLGYRNSGRTWVETGSGGDYTEINLSLSNSYFLLTAGLALMNNIDVAYGYEISNSTIANRSHGTHEIMVSYTFGQGKKAKSYDDDIRSLKLNQNAMLEKIDTLLQKADDNAKATKEIADINKKQDEQIRDLSADLEKISEMPGIEGRETYIPPTTSPATLHISTGNDNSVYFPTGSYVLNRESKMSLLKFVVVAKEITNAIEVSGYADDVGEDEFNLVLSQKRAQVVADYLISNGIAKERIRINYYGQTKPIVPNNSEEGRSMNRRVDFSLLKE